PRAAAVTGMGSGPTTITNFQAGSFHDEQLTAIPSDPPDTQIAVGPGTNGGAAVMEMLNSTAYFFDQNGAPLAPYRRNLTSFFGTSAAYPTENDARVLYDAQSG